MIARRKRVGSRVITGEATPFYLYYPYAAKRAYEFSPDIKVITVLRDPVERAISHHYHSRTWGVEDLSIEAAFAAEQSRLVAEKARVARDPSYPATNLGNYSYVDRGYYVRQLRVWDRYFPRDRMLILDRGNLFDDTQSILDEVCGFLGIPAFAYCGGANKNITSSKAEVDDALREKIRQQFEAGNEELCDYAGIRF